MKQSNFNRSKLARIMTWEAHEWLCEWIKQRHPVNPYPMEPKDYFYKNTGHREYLSKFIEDVIIKVLRFKGCDPHKAPDKGKVIDNREMVTNVLGQKKIIGSKTYVKDQKVRPGRADVGCFFNGSMYNLEVKVGKDRMSYEQIKERERCEANGEKYVVIRMVDDFITILT